MLKVVVCLEQGVACEKFDKNAPYAPDITRKRPSQSKNNLRSTIVAS